MNQDPSPNPQRQPVKTKPMPDNSPMFWRNPKKHVQFEEPTQKPEKKEGKAAPSRPEKK
jgi:hypothetical protein